MARYKFLLEMKYCFQLILIKRGINMGIMECKTEEERVYWVIFS